MKKILAITAVIVSMLLVLFLASGCFGKNIAERIAEEAIEKAIEKDSGEDVEIDLGDGEISIQSDEGEISISSDDDSIEIKSDDGEATIGTGAELPYGFPDNVPVYPDIEIITSWSSTDENDKSNYSISGLTSDAVDDVFAWYKDKLSGWNIEGEFSMSTDDGETSSLSAKGSGLVVTIMVVETKDEGTTIVQTVAEE